MTRQLRRDPFARATLMSKAHKAVGQTCRFCGQGPNSRGHLYSYWWEADCCIHSGPYRNGHFRHPDVLFCSVSCWRSYNS